MSQLQVTGEAKIRDIQGPVVANSGVITALDGAASQYVRGDGTLADFPTSTGGGSSVSYYLNSSVSQGTIGGVAYRELSKEPIIGAGTDIAISANGYVANYITDANDPDVLSVPGGNFNCEFYFSVNNNTGNPTTYAELYKYDGTTFTLLGSSVAVPESINQGTTIAPYYFAIPVATAALALTDRLAIRIYVNVDGRTVTLHTENSHLCQVVTTFSKGMVSLNNLTDQSQFITTGTSGTNFAIVSSGDTHTFNLPVASATNTGKLSSTDWSTFNGKVPYTGATANVDLGNFNFDANNISGAAIIAKLNGPASSPFVLKSGSSGYTIGDDAISLISSPNVANTLILASNIGVVTKTAQIGLGSLTATRTFTLPDISGTLALLEGTQTFSGAKTFSGLASFTNTSGINLQYGAYINKGNTPLAFSSGTTNIYSDATTNNIVIRDNSSIAKLEFNNSTQTYTFPAASGTIALTSNLSSYVPYTGATGPVNLGFNLLTTNSINLDGNSVSGVLNIKSNSSITTSGAGYVSLVSGNVNQLSFVFNGGNSATFTSVSLSASRTYSLPDAGGTLALTSNLSSYLPLTGGTLTGALSGTTADFSGLGTFYQLTMTGATAGRIFYAQTGGVVSQSGNLNWNETNGMLGVGTPNPSAVITAFSTNAATQFKAAGTAPAFTFSNTLTSPTLGCVFGLATASNHFVTGTAAGDMAIANQSTVAGAIVFGTGTTERMRMSAAGRFLINTSVDNGASLQVNGAATFSDSVTNKVTNISADGAGVVLQGYVDNSLRIAVRGSGYNSGARGGLLASTGDFSSSVTATNGIFSGELYNTTTGAFFIANAIGNTSYPTYGFYNNVGVGMYRPSADVLGFVTSSTERMRITSGGDISFNGGSGSGQVSTATPKNFRFNNDYSTGYTDASLKLYLFNSGTTIQGFTSGPAYDIQYHSSGNDSGRHAFYVANVESMRINKNDVLIGGTTNSYNSRIVVSNYGSYTMESRRPFTGSEGHIVFVNGNGAVGSIFTNGTSTSYNTSSDYRLKEDLKDFIGLDLVSAIKTYDYKWKTDESRAFGVLAHELQEVLPYAVSGEKDGEMMQGVDYSKIVPILVKAIQEQQAQIEELKSLINK